MSEQLLRVREVAQMLGKAEMIVYRMIAAGVLPSLRMGKSIRIREVDIKKHIRNLKNKG